MPQVPESEFSERFVKLMRNRMHVSFFKYGPIALAYPPKVDALKCLADRIVKYMETSNTEYLVDAANFAMIEFMHPSKLDAHFTATDDSGSPGRIDVDGYRTKKRNDQVETLEDRRPQFPS